MIPHPGFDIAPWRRAAFRLSFLLLLLFATPPAFGQDVSRIRSALAHPNLKGAEVGVEVVSITRNVTVYSLNARQPLLLASNNKVITTASALHHLGADHKLLTRIYVRGAVEDGVLIGDLWLRGGGDPFFSELKYVDDPMKPVEDLAAAVAAAGIRAVTGRLVADDTIFDREYTAPGWPRDQLNRHYCAPVSGLSLLENVVWIEVRPGSAPGRAATLSCWPPGAPFRFAGSITTGTPGTRNVINLGRPGEDGRIRVNGKTPRDAPSSRFPVAVRRPPEYFGAVLQAALGRKGVTIRGGLALAAEAPDYEKDMRLLATESTDLVSVVNVVNKTSHNHCADQLFKLAGWKVAGKGTYASGEAAARKLFTDLGIEDADPISMADGSGLSRNNRFSAHTVACLLTAIYRSPSRDVFIRSLPVAGKDGSLSKRMTSAPYTSRVRAKTGWIRGVSALSGYAHSVKGETFAFSILINGYRGSNSVMKSVQDDVCRTLVDG